MKRNQLLSPELRFKKIRKRCVIRKDERERGYWGLNEEKVRSSVVGGDSLVVVTLRTGTLFWFPLCSSPRPMPWVVGAGDG